MDRVVCVYEHVGCVHGGGPQSGIVQCWCVVQEEEEVAKVNGVKRPVEEDSDEEEESSEEEEVKPPKKKAKKAGEQHSYTLGLRAVLSCYL